MIIGIVVGLVVYGMTGSGLAGVVAGFLAAGLFHPATHARR